MIAWFRRHMWWWTPIAAGIILGIFVWVLSDLAADRNEEKDRNKALQSGLIAAVNLEQDRTAIIVELDTTLTKTQEALAEAQATIARLERQVADLARQVAALGGTPVVVVEEPQRDQRASAQQGPQPEPAPGRSGDRRNDQGRARWQ